MVQEIKPFIIDEIRVQYLENFPNSRLRTSKRRGFRNQTPKNAAQETLQFSLGEALLLLHMLQKGLQIA